MVAIQHELGSSIKEVLKLVWGLRFAENKMLLLSRQSDSGGTFQLSCAGHELVGVVAGKYSSLSATLFELNPEGLKDNLS